MAPWDPMAEQIRVLDVSREPHPDPCQSCEREHLRGEHVVWSVPGEQGQRTVWEGCADCWVKISTGAGVQPPDLSTEP